MRRFLSVVIAILLAVLCLQGCADNSFDANDTMPPDDKNTINSDNETTASDSTSKEPENSNADSKAIHDMLYSAIGKTAECESLMLSVIEIDDDYKYGMNDIDRENQGLSAYFDSYTTTRYDVFVRNKSSENVELYYSEKMDHEVNSYSVNTGDLLFHENSAYEYVNYIADGYHYKVIKRTGEEDRTSKREYDGNLLIVGPLQNILGGYKNGNLEKIDYTAAEVETSDGVTSVTIPVDREVYGLVLEILNPSHDEEKSYTYLGFKDTTLTFTVSDGFLTGLKYKGFIDDYDTDVEEDKYQPWSLEYCFSGFDGNFTITPPDGYENFEFTE